MDMEIKSAVEAEAILGVLDQIDYGLAVIDGARLLRYINRAGTQCLASSDALEIGEDRRLEVRDREDGQAWRRAVGDAVQARLRTLLTVGQGVDSISLAVVPLETRSGESLALVVIGRHRVCETLTAQMYATRHGLTSAESRVLQLLCTGDSPITIARRHRVAISTVRTQIGSIRAKTGARTVSALVREVALLPPLMNVLSTA
jgi:DNA-binding CsgD family transcriptional regulator